MTAGSASIPFGLAVAAREPIPVDEVDLEAVVYDTDRQIMLVRDSESGTAIPWCRHSTGKTNTRTSDGHKSMDSDTDHTED